MKKLSLKMLTSYEMIQKSQMKKITGGYTGEACSNCTVSGNSYGVQCTSDLANNE